MFHITPTTANRFAVPAARTSQPAKGAPATKAAQPAFGLETASFKGKAAPVAAQPKFTTPKLEMSQPVGQRLNILA